MNDVQVKAVPVNGLYTFVQTELTSEQLKAAIDSLPPDERQWFTGHLLAHQQVPYTAVNRFTVEAAKQKGEPLESFSLRAGRYGANLGIKTVYKFVMMVMSIEAVLRKAPLMWSRVYDRGKMTVESASGSARIHVADFPSDEAGCGRATGWFTVIGEKAGAKNLKVDHPVCRARGGHECRWDFQWDE
ncbi:MAG: hypothetical protein KY432_00220 [Acidobacteria bacterium]|nr:hypothetical protein [Acidobacteriota bacterium]